MSDKRPNVCVFAPNLSLSITVERRAGGGSEAGDELHFHPGGQGLWIARMLSRLGERPVVVAPLGGETGLILRALVSAWDVALSPVEVEDDSPAYVHDRRSGEREELARSPLPKMDRHESDELFGRLLDQATRSGTCVVSGRAPGDSLSLDFYRRLGVDLVATDVIAIGDLHGEELAAFLDGGALHTLKVSDADLVEDGALSAEATVEERLAAADRYVQMGAERVVISGIGHAVARFGDLALHAKPPVLEAADHRGSGDAMTAGLVVAALRRMVPIRAVQLSCGAGAASATRHGLASADRNLVESLADKVEVEELTEK